MKLQKEHGSVLEETKHLLEALQEIGNMGVAQATRKSRHSLNRLNKLVVAHHRKEEKMLLAIMNERLDKEVGLAILGEHREISNQLREISKLLEEYNPKAPSSTNVIEKSVSEFDSTMRAHFSREENVLYWYASLCISSKGSH